MNTYTVPAIAVPHQAPPVIWWTRESDDDQADAHDMTAVLESREEAENYVRLERHQWTKVAALIDEAWPQ